jgi:maltokinase
VDTSDLTTYLGRQRWFGGKGRSWRVTKRQHLAPLRDEPPYVRVELVTLTYDGTGELETYQIPLEWRREPSDQLAHAFIGEHVDPYGTRYWVYEALHDKEVTGLWTHGIADERDLGAMSFHREPSAGDFPAGEPSLVIGAEQSNTSVVYGDALILKVLRKVSPGVNPDIELHSALAAAGSVHIARPLGWVEGRWEDPATGEAVSGSLAILQEFLRNATDGWDMARTSVRDLFGEADLHADEVGGDFASESFRLGVATAEVHGDLARVLPTDTLRDAQVAALAAAMRRRLHDAVQEVGELRAHAEALDATFDELSALRSPVPVQRVHGDLHLGQVMRTLDGWKLLDFEGEPAKPLGERRDLESPLKDVAGMLRSFDYAARHLLAGAPHDAQREYRASEWAQRNRDAFCDGYAKGCGHDPRAGDDGSDVVLRAFEVDKAVYEVMYEARNRPSWLPIPLAAVERLAAASRRTGTS